MLLADKYLFCTIKKKDIKHLNSHILMLEAGIIKKLSSGIYYWLPTGLKIIKNINNIIRKSMDLVNAIEISIPILQPINIWLQSGRNLDYGMELFKIIDRKKNIFILSPTNEEAITYCVLNIIKSYKDLPIHLYQIQTKFRDEIRPRLGSVRAKEFIMKDSYSFHLNKNCLQQTYNNMLHTYKKIFNYMKLDYVTVIADNNIIGGTISHEFHLFSEHGENCIVHTSKYDYIANIEYATYLLPQKKNINAKKILEKQIITSTKKILDICKDNNISTKKIINTFIIKNNNKENSFVMILIRYGYKFNINKFIKQNPLFISCKMLSEIEIKNIFHIHNINSLGPYNINIPIIADYSVINMYNFIIGINNNQYYINANWNIDLILPNNIQDIRYITYHDLAPNGNKLIITKSIEIAHIFQLDTKYSEAMNLYIYDMYGLKQYLYMGCYGIGITRIMAAIIEQHHDKHGIIWPTTTLAPFKIAIIPINMHNNDAIKNIAYTLYKKFLKHQLEILLDNRLISFGKMLTDMDLIGIPHIIIISAKHLKNHNIEYKSRNTNTKIILSIKNIVSYIINQE
ncbi:proline--tRNA ligase [Enterobacteriaceae endosymbiont of Macroplea appendiculata]|nr:proline--tRNA ligase [Enterobacteriaceae endosymbiont of Macroplea appendiculata]